MRKKLLSIALCATMVAGIFTGCGSSSDTSKKDEGKSADGKITLNVINYHVGTDYAADYYEYLFDRKPLGFSGSYSDSYLRIKSS